MEKKKISSRGGARPGAGRKKGGTNGLTIESLLATVQAKSGGHSYEEILIDDFLTSRATGDGALTQKYHHLILSKVAPTLARVETIESEDAVASRAEAFAEALQALASIPQAKGK